MNIKGPVVSICTITYKHEHCIKDTILGVLTQRTSFDVEFIIADDCSPDGTQNIIEGIRNSHPNGKIIKYTRHPVNMGMNANLAWALGQCKGNYIALCEGDDYWTDPNKLQKQFDILERHESLAMCTHETRHIYFPKDLHRTYRRALSIVYRDFQLYGFKRLAELAKLYFFDHEKFWHQERSHLDQIRKEINHLEDFAGGRWYMSFCSIFMRKAIIDPLPDCYLTTNGGHQLTLLLGAMNGGIFHLNDKMAVKRDQETSISKDKNRKEKISITNKNLENNNRLNRFKCLQSYANDDQKLILEGMIQNYIQKMTLDN